MLLVLTHSQSHGYALKQEVRERSGGRIDMARGLATMLYGVSPYDPMSFVVVPILLLGVAILASLIPARRAARVDPMEALKAD